MAQAAVDLPESANRSTAPTSADDLLSQLAGEEIDRMLAADADSAPKTEHQDAPSPAVATEEPAGASTAPAVEESQPSTPQESEKSAQAQDAFSAEVDQLFRQLDEEKLESPKIAQANPEPPKSEPTAAAAVTKLQDAMFASNAAPQAAAVAPDEPKVEKVEEEESTSTAERAALQEPLAATAPPAPAAPIAVPTAPEQAATENPETVHVLPEPRVPIYVRALELLNGPFADCPTALRDTLGKIAILTLVNAIGVLIFVMLFRK